MNKINSNHASTKLLFSESEVYNAFESAEILELWWARKGYSSEFEVFEFAEGGAWQYILHGSDGKKHVYRSIFEDLVPNSRIVVRNEYPQKFKITITLVPEVDGTKLNWEEVFEDEKSVRIVRGSGIGNIDYNIKRLTSTLYKLAWRKSFLMMRKVFKYIGLIFLGLIAWISVVASLASFARKIVKYIAFNITNSGAGNGKYYYKFEWDYKLQLVVYALYAILFIISTFILTLLLKRYGKDSRVRNFLTVLFILSFPTHTFWLISTNCNGFGPCGHVAENVVVPVIMSINPIGILLSSGISYAIARFYIGRYA